MKVCDESVTRKTDKKITIVTSLIIMIITNINAVILVILVNIMQSTLPVTLGFYFRVYYSFSST